MTQPFVELDVAAAVVPRATPKKNGVMTLAIEKTMTVGRRLGLTGLAGEVAEGEGGAAEDDADKAEGDAARAAP